eukprot:4144669-Pleurochrysis_carterae.AAC.2
MRWKPDEPMISTLPQASGLADPQNAHHHLHPRTLRCVAFPFDFASAPHLLHVSLSRVACAAIRTTAASTSVRSASCGCRRKWPTSCAPIRRPRPSWPQSSSSSRQTASSSQTRGSDPSQRRPPQTPLHSPVGDAIPRAD